MIRLFAFKWARLPVRVTSGHWIESATISFEETLYGEIGMCIQPLGLWVGAHYSRHNQRWCINLFPCITVWITMPGGKAP